MRLFDFITFQKSKKTIVEKYKPFGFPVIFSADVNTDSFTDRLAENAFGICTGFNQIFKFKLIEKLEDFVNIHPSLLPFYRGPTPVEWCVANKEKFTGWTLHSINEKIDAGEILFQEVIDIRSKRTFQIKSELSNQAAEVLFNYLNKKRNDAEFKIIKVDTIQYYQNSVGYKYFL